MLDFSRVHKVLTNLPVVLCTLLIFVFTNLVAVARWQGLLRGQSIHITYLEALKLCMIGVFFNTAIPGAVSGDVVKGYYIVSQQPNKRGRIKAFATLFIDRLLGLSALICVSFVAMLFHYKSMSGSGTLKPLCGLITLLWLGVVAFYAFVLIELSLFHRFKELLRRLPGVGDLASRMFEAVKIYENRRHIIVQGLLMSVAIHCALIFSFIILARTLGGFGSVSTDKFFFLVPFGLLVTAIPIAPAGLGTGHAAFLALFQLVGSKAGADLFTAYVSFQIFLSLVGGIFYVQYRSSHKAPPDDLEAEIPRFSSAG